MKCKLLDVLSVKVLSDYQLELRFDNGVSGIVDISNIVPFEGIFEPLKNKDYFARVALNSEIGTIFWENGADISPSLLFEHLITKHEDAA